MTPNFTHIFHPMFVGVELTQVCCGGNQTAVLVTSEESSVLQMSGKEEASKKSLQQQQLYVWGSGRSATQMRVPIPLPPKCNIAQLSCGNTHMGFITERGQAFTWGSGDYGMLGHGTKSNVAEPRRVETFKQLVCTAISCGAFHTGFIACSKADMSYIRLPRKEHLGSSLGVGNAGAKIILSEECAAGGSLYMCGLGKAGQLGVNTEKIPMTGANAGFCARPTLVSYFEEEGARVIRVSCGFHHTLAIAVPKQALRIFSPSVFAFGFGEYGRLGLGHEDQVSLPTMLEFPGPFHATQVSAGEQHSVALGHDGCYAWGSNDMGQLGIGSPSQVEFASLPQKIALPEGMVARKLVAGGRHTAAVTHCGNVLSWGWGEEGQLGHGTEKSANLPRPCRLISVHGNAGVPMDVTLGGTHTAVVLHNPSYIPPTVREPTPEPETVAEPTPREPTPEPEPEPVPEAPVEEPVVEASVLVQSIEAPLVTMLPPVEHKPPMISTSEDECAEEVAVVEEEEAPTPAPPPIRSLKDILNQREERRYVCVYLDIYMHPTSLEFFLQNYFIIILTILYCI